MPFILKIRNFDSGGQLTFCWKLIYFVIIMQGCGTVSSKTISYYPILWRLHWSQFEQDLTRENKEVMCTNVLWDIGKYYKLSSACVWIEPLFATLKLKVFFLNSIVEHTYDFLVNYRFWRVMDFLMWNKNSLMVILLWSWLLNCRRPIYEATT